MIPPICSGLSMQYTKKPSASNCLFRLTCKGRSSLPGAFNSMKASLPPGRSTRRSGTPSSPGLMNFGARPPIYLTALTSFASTVFSLMGTPCYQFSLPSDAWPFLAYRRSCVPERPFSLYLQCLSRQSVTPATHHKTALPGVDWGVADGVTDPSGD